MKTILTLCSVALILLLGCLEDNPSVPSYSYHLSSEAYQDENGDWHHPVKKMPVIELGQLDEGTIYPENRFLSWDNASENCQVDITSDIMGISLRIYDKPKENE